MPVRGSCHCGNIRFHVDDEPRELLECNCSICRKKGFLHWIVPQASLQFAGTPPTLATYTFHTGVAKHLFCPICGIAPFYVPRSHPESYDVNARCLDDFALADVPVRLFDGQNWESAIVELRATRATQAGSSG